MNQIAFKFERHDDGTATGFDLGHATVIGPSAKVTSRGHTPDQSMMIYISLADLMHGLAKLWVNNKPGSFKFVGTDSSFTILFEAESRERVIVSSGPKTIGTVSLQSAIRALADAVDRFLAAPGSALSVDDAAQDDLRSGRAALRAALDSQGQPKT